MSDINLPEGWKSEQMPYSRNILVIDSPRGEGFVSVDFDTRGFRGGMSMSGPLMRHGVYSGRGWRQRLVDDAVEWLRGIIES